MNKVQQIPKLTLAEGGIDPRPRLESGEIAEDQLQRFIKALNDEEFYDEIDAAAIPCMCVDGRCGHCPAGPNAAGGTLSLVIGDALTNGAYHLEGETAPQHAKRMFGELVKMGQRIGGHDDSHAEGLKSGCGAQDKLALILEFITRKGTAIRQSLEGLGIEIDDQLHEMILAKANELLQQGYATNGAELRTTYIETAGNQAVDTVEGDHGEVVLNVNTKPGKTLNRHKLKARFGDQLQAFNLDVPGLLKGVETISLNPGEVYRKFIGALYYNMATAGVLAGPGLYLNVR